VQNAVRAVQVRLKGAEVPLQSGQPAHATNRS
jgi:hypothetical protein